MAKGYLKQIQLRIHESPEGSIFVNSKFLFLTNSDCFNSSQFHLLALRTRSIPRSKSSVNSNLLLLSVSAED